MTQREVLRWLKYSLTRMESQNRGESDGDAARAALARLRELEAAPRLDDTSTPRHYEAIALGTVKHFAQRILRAAADAFEGEG